MPQLYGCGHGLSGCGLACRRRINGVTIEVIDARGAFTKLTSNAAGNFHTSAALAQPLRSVSVVRGNTTAAMMGAPAGACSSCHGVPPAISAPGRVYAR